MTPLAEVCAPLTLKEDLSRLATLHIDGVVGRFVALQLAAVSPEPDEALVALQHQHLPGRDNC